MLFTMGKYRARIFDQSKDTREFRTVFELGMKHFLEDQTREYVSQGYPWPDTPSDSL